MHTPWNRRIIAHGSLAQVEHCADCDIVHLHLGALTLRLKPAVLQDLRDTLSQALENMPAGRTTDIAGAGARPDGSCH